MFAAAARTGTALEINSYPDRLDLPDELILRAKRHGVSFAINTDSHSTVHLRILRYGVGHAQRGWLTTDDVINAWPLSGCWPSSQPSVRRLGKASASPAGSRVPPVHEIATRRYRVRHPVGTAEA